MDPEMEDYEDSLEEQQEEREDYEHQQEMNKRMGWENPIPKESESLYNLFHKVLDLGDSSKVGNLDKVELGMLNLSARDCQRIALLAEALNHPKFAAYFLGVGEIILRTSASKKGWFTELFVSQKKFAAKSVKSPEEPEKKKWKLGK